MDVHTFLRSVDDQVSFLLQDFPSLERPDRAFVAWCLVQVLGISEEDAVESVVDGPDDKGIESASRTSTRISPRLTL
jgi:hypothetical protein